MMTFRYLRLGAKAERDLTGQRFGKLVAVRPGGYASKQRWWYCRCDCGTEVLRAGGNLLKTRSLGHTSSCEACNPNNCNNTKPEPVRASKRQRCEHGFVDPLELCVTCQAKARRSA
jgi:hypothetical protein